MVDTAWQDFPDVTSLQDTDILLALRGAGGINFLASLLVRYASPGGNVGIGTNSPTAKLDVAGDVTTIANSMFGSNIYYDGAWRYRGNGYAGVLKLADSSGSVVILTAPNNAGGAGAAAAPVERLRIDANNGNISAAGSVTLANNRSYETLNSFGFAGVRQLLQNDNNWVTYIRNAGGGYDPAFSIFTGQTSGQHSFNFSTGINQVVAADNLINLGSATGRWKQVFAVNGAINTSDEREKLWITITEDRRVKNRRIARAIFDELGWFQWKDAVAEKGEDEARWHFGPRAQRVWAIFAAEGLCAPLVGTGYNQRPDPEWKGPPPPALLCFDEWPEERSTEPVYSSKLVGEDGNPLQTGTMEVVTREAGNRFGLRVDQLGLLLDWSLHERLSMLEAA